MNLTPVERREYENETLKQALSKVSGQENKYLIIRLIFAFIIYVATMFVYYGIFLAKEDEESTRGLAILNPAFIVASDIVILSLRQ